MKTAIERYMETVTVQEKQKILAEQEMSTWEKENVDTVIQLIENGIDRSVGEGKFNRTITFIQCLTWTQYHGPIYLWYVTYPQSKWTDYNSRANAYYTIPRFDVPLSSVNKVIDYFVKQGYQCTIEETVVPEATTRTGKYAADHVGYEVNIDWTNSLTIIGSVNANG